MVVVAPVPDHGVTPLQTPGLPMQAGSTSRRSTLVPTALEARMHPLLNRICRNAALPRPLPTVLPVATAAETGAEAAAPAAEAGACGWFDSSLDLRQGLAISEVRDIDWTVLVLWFGPAALGGPARLQ